MLVNAEQTQANGHENSSDSEYITATEARKMMGISHETWRRHLALGYYKKIRFYRPGPLARPRVSRQSVLDTLADVKAYDER